MTSARSHDAVALIYDLEGFSKFANQPDAHNYVPRFLNHVSRAIEVVLYGGVPYWIDDDNVYEPLLEPAHQKFLGDGALYIWTAGRNKPITQRFAADLLNRLRALTANFAAVEKSSVDRVPVALRPKRIRFGLSAGKVHELRRTDVRVGSHEYAGICINLASRLQSYCPGVSLLASARLGLSSLQRAKHGYVRVLAKKIKGFPAEPVLLDSTEFVQLKPTVRARYFATE